MKKIKRALVTLGAAMLVVASALPFAACGKSGSVLKSNVVTEDIDVVAYDGSEVTILFYHTMGEKLRTVLNKYIPKFNEMYPKIKVVHETQGDYPTLRKQISTELSGLKAPSLAYCYSDHVATYNAASAVLKLDQVIASTDTATKADGTTETMGYSQTQLDDFVEGYYAEGSTYGDGYMYTLPFSKSTEVLYYNKTYFEANKLSVPTTWDEMETLCQTILDLEEAKGKKCVPLGYDSEANWFITMCEQYGSDYTSATGDHFLFNNATNQAFVKKFAEWYRKGYVITEEIYGTYTSDLFTAAETAALRSFMTIGSSAGASYQCPKQISGSNEYPFEVGIAQIPQVDVENPKVISQGPSVCIFKKDDPQEVAAAWLFTKFLTTCVEFQAEFSMVSGYAPIIKSVEENEVYQEDFLQLADGNAFLQASCVKQSLAQKNALYVSPAFVGSADARDEVGALMKTCFVESYKNLASIDTWIAKQFSDTVSDLEYFYPSEA